MKDCIVFISSLNIGHEDFLELAVEDYNICQSIHRKEFNHLERCVQCKVACSFFSFRLLFFLFWILVFRPCKQVGCWAQIRQAKVCSAEASVLLPLCCCRPFPSGTIRCSHVMGQKCISHNCGWWFLWHWWFGRGTNKPYTIGREVCDSLSVSTRSVVNESLLVMVIIVFLLFNRRWDVDASVDCCSKHVEIIFSALKDTISEIGVKAFNLQGRNVTTHVIKIVR